MMNLYFILSTRWLMCFISCREFVRMGFLLYGLVWQNEPKLFSYFSRARLSSKPFLDGTFSNAVLSKQSGFGMGWREGQRWKTIQRLRNPNNSCWLRQEGKNAWNKWKLNFQIANIFASEAHSTNNTLFRLSLSRFLFLLLFLCFLEKAIHYHHLKFKIVIKKRLIYSVQNDIFKCKRNNMYLNGCDCRELICLPGLAFFARSTICIFSFDLFVIFIHLYSFRCVLLLLLSLFLFCHCDDVVTTFICSSKWFIFRFYAFEFALSLISSPTAKLAINRS